MRAGPGAGVGGKGGCHYIYNIYNGFHVFNIRIHIYIYIYNNFIGCV